MILPLCLAVMTQTPAKSVHGFDQERLQAISRRLRAFVDEGVVAGTVVLVTRNGREVFCDVQGYANLEKKQPMRRDTIFQIMSMTKPITAVAVALCAEDGRLSLDDPIDQHLPGFRGIKVRQPDGTLVDAQVRPTIRHLLTHTAGFGSIDPGGLDDDQKRKLTLAEYAELLPTEPLVGQPGSAIRYSGPGFAALGRIVSVASRLPFDRFVEERITAPLGLPDTFFFAPESKLDRIAFGYFREGSELKPLEADPFRRGARFANPAGGLYSTADDMARLLNALIQADGKGKRGLLSARMLDAMTTIQTGQLLMDGGEAQGFGLGWAVVRSASGQMHGKPIGSFGHTGAFGTEFWADKSRGIVVVFMAQGFDNASLVRKRFNTMLNAAFVGP